MASQLALRALGLAAVVALPAQAQVEDLTSGFLQALVSAPPATSHGFFSEWLANGVPLEDWQDLRRSHSAQFGPLRDLVAHGDTVLEDGDIRTVFHGGFGQTAADLVCGIVIWDAVGEPGVGIRLVRLNFLPEALVALIPDEDRAGLEAQAGCPEGYLSPS